jgi:hypothetical protein
VQDDKRPDFSESDRAKLDQMLDEAEFQKRLDDRHKRRMEGVRTWATWLITVVAALSLIKDAAAALVKHLSDWLGGR